MAITLNFYPSTMTDSELDLAIELCTREKGERERTRMFAKKKEDIVGRFNALLHEYARIRTDELHGSEDISNCYCQDEEDRNAGNYSKLVHGFMIDCDGDLMVVTDNESMEQFGWKQD